MSGKPCKTSTSLPSPGRAPAHDTALAARGGCGRTKEDAMTDDSRWEQLGHAGPHEDHRLHADDMSDVHCLECGTVLDDEEAAEAWPVDEEEVSS